MAKEVPIGLKNFYIGDVAGDGGMGTGLEKVSYAVIDTPVLTIPEGEKADFLIEDSDDPYFSKTTPGVKTLAISFYGLTAASLARWFGGVATIGPASGVDTWEAPLQIATFEASIVAEHQQGGHLKIPRASISATADWNFQKNNLPQINVVATVLTPTKEGEPPMTFSTAEYVE
jgi:hypothetical protein